MLIDFEQSIFSRELFTGGVNPVLPREPNPSLMRRTIRRIAAGTNSVAKQKAEQFVLEATRTSRGARPRVLIIGGGTRGDGTEPLYSAPGITIVGTDVYPSPHTSIVSDAHQLPIDDSSVDGVWIQAVLEHVVDPAIVVAEIYRVLKPEAVVYADTPFMQQVHEGAYDFTRFTLNGHRWLFRRFEQIDAGAVAGPGTALLWSLRYFLASLGMPPVLARVATVPFIWLRAMDRFAQRGRASDAASAVYFFGRKSERELHPKDLPSYYDSCR